MMVMLYHYVHFLAERTPIANRIVTFTESFHIGVDLFFIISGFLITGRLLATKESPRYYGGFYWRRFLRIMPPYFLFLAVALILQPIAIEASDLPWYGLFATNLLIFFFGAQPPLLAPLWSVALEEQFYLIWPTVVKWLTEYRLLVLAIVLIVLQPILRALFPYQLYMNPLTHLDGLLFGVLLCVGLSRYRAMLEGKKRGIVIAALLAVVYFIVRGLFVDLRYWTSNPLAQTLDFTVVTIAFSSLVLYALLQPASWFSRILNGPLFQSFGKLSYSLYLFHMLWLTLWMQVYVPPSNLTGVAALVVVLIQTIGLAVISWCFSYYLWKYFESPILNLKDKVSYQPSIVLS